MPSATSSIAPRVLYLPNELDFREETGQVGGRAAFRAMLNDGILAELRVYSFLAEFYAVNRDKSKAHASLLDVVRTFQPDIIFWQHPSDYGLDQELLLAIRACGSSPVLVYQEGDPFDTWYKTIHSEVKTLYAESDVFFTIGLGAARRQFFAIRAHPHFYYSPHCFDVERIGSAAPRMEEIGSRYDAIMIGTIAARMKGMLKQPHAMNRVRLAQGLAKIFGDRFAAFGRGWPADANPRGMLPFAEQAITIQSSRMSVIWELYPEYSFYHSDRLPIALAAGIPFVSNFKPGYETLFRNVPGVFTGDTIEEILDICVYLRGLPVEEIAALGAGARNYAFSHFEAKVVFRKMLDVCIDIWRKRSSSTVDSTRKAQ
jgi:hypothetical protein